MNSLFSCKEKIKGRKNCRRHMVVMLAVSLLLCMSSMAMAGSQTKYTGRAKIHDNYYAEGKVTATVKGALWWKTGGADGWTFYTDQSGASQNDAYIDCGMVYAMVSFYTSGNVLSEFRSSPMGQPNWAVIPVNVIGSVQKVEARFNMYDYCGKRYIAPNQWQTAEGK